MGLQIVGENKQENTFDVIVIGAGIVGLSCAYYLSKEKKRVLVLEKEDVGSGTSSACDHMILLQSKAPGLPVQLAMRSLELYRSLAKELSDDIELETRGGMIVVDKEEQLPIIEDFVTKQRKTGLAIEFLYKKLIKKKQPFLTEAVFAATYCADDSQVNPLKTMYALTKACLRQGVVLRRNAEVTELARTNLSWKVSTSGNKTFFSECVVVAAGVWTPLLAKFVDLNLPIEPKRGQILVTEPLKPFGETNLWDADYIISKHLAEFQRDEVSRKLGLGFAFSMTRDGNCFIGSTREYVGFDKRTTYEALKALSARAYHFFPKIFEKIRIIRTFAGLRPACADKKYVIGEDPANPGLFIATGHEGDGIALAPITGKLIADLVCARNLEFDLSQYSPARFRKSVNVVEGV